jgi:hypothetical protein
MNAAQTVHVARAVLLDTAMRPAGGGEGTR